MKLAVILLLGACLQVSAKSYAQRITLNEKNAPLEKVFSEIKRQTGYLFVYRDEWLKKARTVTLEISEGTVEQVLDLCFRDQPLAYTLVDRTVVVRLKEEKIEEAAPAPPPPLRVTGRVIDKSTGKPLAGASVLVKNSNIGTSTDAEGKFVITVDHPNEIVQISYTGYQTIEVPIGGRTELLAELEPSTSELDKVVMIAYGQTTRRLNTGSISEVTSDEIAKQPVSNVLEAMEGRVPGMFIQSMSGQPGAGFSVQLRGLSSIGSGTNPLFIVDGVPYNTSSLDQLSVVNGGLSPLNSINPADIESVEVLKDADATAIYGARGGSGVVLITTKKGKVGKTKLTLNVYRGVGKVSHFMPFLRTPQYLELRRMAFADDSSVATPDDAPDLMTWDTAKNTDWQKKLIGGASQIWDVQATLSGGERQTRFVYSANYHHEGSVFPGSAHEDRLSGRLNLEHNSEDNRFHSSFNVNYSIDNNHLAPDVTSYINLPPDYPAYDTSGKYYWANGLTNPIAFLANNPDNQTTNFISNGMMSYQLVKGLQLKTTFGYTQMDLTQQQSYPAIDQNPAYNPSSYTTFADGHVHTWVVEPQVDYNARLGPGKLSLLLGSTFQETVSKGNYVYAYNFSSDALLGSLAAAGGTFIQSNVDDYRYNSVFGRINYSIANTYVVNLTGRRDGSSRFGPRRQFGNFASAGAAWIFSQEPWAAKTIPFLHYGKLRASYGITGNDQIADYGYLSTYSSTPGSYQVPGLYPTRIQNSDYSWETNRKLESGLELGFLKSGAILFTVDYFRNRSGDQLVNYPLAGQSGFTFYQANSPAIVQNTGWELTLNTDNIKSSSFSWSTTVNVSIPRNKLVAFPNLSGSSYGTADLVIGQPLNLAWGYNFSGVDRMTGLGTFEDADKNGVISYPGDFKAFGTTLPRFFGGLGNSIRYGQLQLDFFFRFTRVTTNNSEALFYAVPGNMINITTAVYNHIWKAPGDLAGYSRPATGGAGAEAYYKYFSSYQGAFEDGSYVKLSNLSLTYNLPSGWLSKWKIAEGKLFFEGKNLLTITKYSGPDPESAGTPYGVYLPNLRVVTLGLHCTF